MPPAAVKRHTRAPVLLFSAAMNRAVQPCRTSPALSATIALPYCTSPPVAYDHLSAPVLPFSAYKFVSQAPMYTVPSASSAGVAVM